MQPISKLGKGMTTLNELLLADWRQVDAWSLMSEVEYVKGLGRSLATDPVESPIYHIIFGIIGHLTF